MKKVLCTLLVMIMVLTSVPLGGFTVFDSKVFATDTSVKDIITDTDDTITRAQWLHNLAVIFEMTVEDEIYPDNYFSDLEDTHEYYYDILLNVNFGVIDIEAGGELCPQERLTRSFAAQTMNYCLGFQYEGSEYSFSDIEECAYPDDAQVSVDRGWFSLIDGEFCGSKTVSDAEVAVITEDAMEEVAKRVITDDYDSEYTYHESVIDLTPETEVAVDENILTITDCKENLKSGDIFAAYRNGIPKIYKAIKVTTNGNVTSITTDAGFDGSDLFLSLDAEGKTEISSFDIETEEDTVMTVEEIMPETAAYARARGTIELDKVYTFKKSIKLAEGANVVCEVKMENPQIQYRLKTNPIDIRVVFVGDAEINFSGNLNIMEALGKDEILIGNIGVPGIGGVGIYVDLSLEGSVGLATTGKLRFGVGYTRSDGFMLIRSFSSTGFSIVAEAAASLGITAKLGITEAPVINAYVYYKVGGKAGIDIKIYSDGNTPHECSNFAAFVYMNFGVSASVKFLNYSDSFEKKYQIWTVENSPVKVIRHYEDSKQVCSCARGNTIDYFTTWDSVFASSEWLKGTGSIGYKRDKTPVTIYEYSLDSAKNATITSYYGNVTTLHIPSKIDGYDVVALGNNAFKNNKLLRNVVIPDSVISIGDSCFSGCSNLSSVNLPAKLETLKCFAFCDCISLTSINIPKSLKEAEMKQGLYGPELTVFFNCPKLSIIEFEEGITEIIPNLFAYCTGIETLIIPDTVQKIGNSSFKGCTGLASLTIPSSVSIIDEKAFYNCGSLTQLVMPDSVTTVNACAFENCNNISSVRFSEGLTFIGANAFRNNDSLTEINLPDSVKTVKEGAFLSCDQLSDVRLSKSLEELGGYALGDCDSLTSIEIPKSIKNTTSAYYIDYMYGYHYGVFVGCDNLKNITYENGITLIPAGIFANCNSIETMDIPDTVRTVGDNAFLNCQNLTSVNLSSNLQTIGANAFRNTGIDEINMSDTVVMINSGAFADCAKLKTVNLSKGLITVGAYAFACCTGLESIEIPKSIKNTTDAYYVEYKYGYHYGVFFGCDNLKNISFEKGITTIPCGLFANFAGLEKIDIPDTVTLIEHRAFLDSANLKDVIIGKNVKKINEYSFSGTGIETVELPSALEYIGYRAFSASALKSITIPDSVTKIDNNAFENCSSLASAKISESLTALASYMFSECSALEEITLPDGILTISDHVFKNCSSLKKAVLNKGLVSVGGYAFENCDSLTNITIPDTVTSYGEGVFYDCDALKNVNLGNGMSSLPKRFFEHCDELENVVLPYSTASIGDGAFKDSVKIASVTIPRVTSTIASSAFSYPTQLTIYGVAGTYAETYANEIGATFVDKQVNAKKVSLNKTTVTLNKGQTDKLIMTVTPADFTDEVVWKSSNTDVVTVAADGTLTAKNVGTATIKLTVGKVSTSCKVTVVQPVTNINIDKSNVTMDALDTYQLNVYVYPDNAENKALKWSSSASDIVSVSSNGLVTAHKKGEAIIKAETQDGSGKYDTCKIIVSNNGIIAKKVSELESSHNYPVNCTDFWQYTLNGADSIAVTFDAKTNIENGFDYLYVYDGNSNEVGKYTGKELAGKTITVMGNTVRIQLASDDSGTEWGFKVREIKSLAEHTHNYSSQITKQATCTDTGVKTFTCSCKDSYSESIPKLGHKFSTRFTVDKAATFTENGSKSKHCTRTDCLAKSEVTVIPKLEASFDDSDAAKIVDSALITIAGTSIKQLLSQTGTGAVINDNKGNILAADKLPCTGMTLVLADGKEYTIAVFGDVDCDGKISAADARLALRASVGLEDYKSTSAQYKAANVGTEDKLSAADARLILRASVGLEDPKEWMK